jgi:uncharacterized membrane protein
MRKLSAILLFLLAAQLGAQELPQPVKVVATVLGLSEGQTMALVQAIQARDTAVRPLAEEAQAHQQALAALLESDAPDPANVGNLVLEIHALQKSIEGIAGEAMGGFEQTLSDAQRDRLANLRQAAPACEVLPAFRAVGLL